MAGGRFQVLVLAALCALPLGGCAGNGDFELDPSYWFPDGKKKLPGERREVFPGGVPGVTQGVPPELIKGNASQQAAVESAAPETQAAPAASPQAEEKPKPAARAKAKRRPTAIPRDEAPAQQSTARSQPQQPQAQPQPQSRQGAQGAWPSPQQATQPQSAPAASAWPSPPATGTFTR